MNKSGAVYCKRVAATVQITLTALEGVNAYRNSRNMVSILSMLLNRLRNEKMKGN